MQEPKAQERQLRRPPDDTVPNHEFQTQELHLGGTQTQESQFEEIPTKKFPEEKSQPLAWVSPTLEARAKLEAPLLGELLKELILRHDFWTANQHGRGSKHYHTRFMKPACYVNTIGK